MACTYDASALFQSPNNDYMYPNSVGYDPSTEHTLWALSIRSMQYLRIISLL